MFFYGPLDGWEDACGFCNKIMCIHSPRRYFLMSCICVNKTHSCWVITHNLYVSNHSLDVKGHRVLIPNGIPDLWQYGKAQFCFHNIKGTLSLNILCLDLDFWINNKFRYLDMVQLLKNLIRFRKVRIDFYFSSYQSTDITRPCPYPNMEGQYVPYRWVDNVCS